MSAPAAEPSAGPSPLTAAARRLAAIRGAISDGALRLAYHAAVPVVLDAGLLNLLRVNFFLDEPLDELPFEVEAELLLSPLFREIGEGLYEIDPGVRNLLLSGLYNCYSRARVHRVAALLQQYTDASAAWRSLPELELAQQLTALGFLDPSAARGWLDARAANVEQSSSPAADAGPSREWYVAMHRRMDENEAVNNADDEVRAVGISLVALSSSDDIGARLSLIRDLRALADLPGTDPDWVITTACAFIEAWDRGSSLASPKAATPDVQAALTLIGSVPHTSFSLSNVSLSEVDLAGLDFSGARFSGVTLTEVNAAGIDLSRARFTDVSLVEINLAGARLVDTRFTEGTLTEVNAAGIDLSRARFTDVSLVEANLDGARLEDASLHFRLLQNVTMRDAVSKSTRIEAVTTVHLTATLPDGRPMLINVQPANHEPSATAAVTPLESPAQAPPASTSRGMDALLELAQTADSDDTLNLLAATLARLRAELGPAGMTDYLAAFERLSSERSADPFRRALIQVSRGDSFTEVHRFDEAVAAYREAIRLDPSFAAAHSGMGSLLLSTARFAEAEAAFREAIRLDPSVVASYSGLGAVLRSERRFAEAEVAFREAIRRDPLFVAAHSGLGAALVGQARYADALTAFTEAFRLDPADATLYPELGEALQRVGRAVEAVGSVRSGETIASGFWTGPRTFVTVAHVVRDGLAPVVTYRSAFGEQEVEMEVLSLDTERDVAVLGALRDRPVSFAWLTLFVHSDSMRRAERVRLPSNGQGPNGRETTVAGRWSGTTLFSGDTATIRAWISVESYPVPSGLSGTPVIRARDGAVAGMAVDHAMRAAGGARGPEEILALVAETVVDGLKQAPGSADVILMHERSAGSPTPVTEPAPLRVFVSSPYSPRLTPYRQAATKVCDQLGMVCVARDDVGLTTSASEEIRQSVASSDVLVLLLADRYGTLPTGERRSYTELEYDQAREARIPVLAFIAPEPGSLLAASSGERAGDPEATQPGPDADSDSDAEELRRFKNQVLSQLIVAPLTDISSFHRSLTDALTQVAADLRAVPRR